MNSLRFCLVLVAAFITTFHNVPSIAAENTITPEELVRHTQELFDAVVTGNQEPWKKYFADDCMFSDEKGRHLERLR